jgi:hypothetical protein
VTAPGATSEASDLRADRRRVVDLARMAAAAYQRPDLASSLATALLRMDRPQTLVAFVGEYKKGKGSIVNALLGDAVVPISDDRATAVLTVLACADERAAFVTSAAGGEQVRAAADWEEAVAVVSELDGSSTNAVLVELGLPNDLLKTGISMVDTPGAGAMSVSDALVSPALLRAMDAIVFVTDASAPFLRSELDALGRAAAATPATVVAVNKVDLYPEWQRVAREDEAAIASAGLVVPVLPVSTALWDASVERGDESLAERSGVPGLRALLTDVAADPTRVEAALRGVDEAIEAVEALRETTAAELTALANADGDDNGASYPAADAARERLRHLRGSGGRWGQVLNEALSDGFSETEHLYRSALRNVQREFEERVEKMDPARDWDELTAWAREEAGRINEQLFENLDEAARNAEQRVADWLQEDDVARTQADSTGAGSITVEMQHDLSGTTNERPGVKPGVKKAASLAFSGLRGGQGGILTIGTLAGLVGVSLSTPVTAGIGLAFAGKQLLDERSRAKQQRRQQARTIGRQFFDDLQFETGKRLRDVQRDVQRRLRDSFSELVARREATLNQIIAASDAALATAAEQRSQRAAALRERLRLLVALEEQARAVGDG